MNSIVVALKIKVVMSQYILFNVLVIVSSLSEVSTTLTIMWESMTVATHLVLMLPVITMYYKPIYQPEQKPVSTHDINMYSIGTIPPKNYTRFANLVRQYDNTQAVTSLRLLLISNKFAFEIILNHFLRTKNTTNRIHPIPQHNQNTVTNRFQPNPVNLPNIKKTKQPTRFIRTEKIL